MLDKIIHFLKNSDGYISGEEISESLKISRAGIWKHIQELRTHGYDIVAVPHLGYKLESSPDKLFPHEIKHNLHTKIFGKKVFYFETVSSTMDEAFRLGMDGSDEGTVVCAESQTKGRGRLGRNWSSPKGKGIYMSVLLRPRLSPANVSQLTLLAAVAVSEAVRKISGLETLIKWPNDILIGHKKVVGILTELSAEADRVKFVTVGIGVNVNTAGGQLLPLATSLRQEADKNFSRIELVQEILRSLENWYLRFQEEGFTEVLARLKELSGTLGKHIKVSDPGETVEGKAVDIDEDGGLLIRSDSGIVVKKMTGDVVQIQ